MKPRRLLYLLILTTLSLCVCAQPRLREPQYYIGVQAGVMASTTMFRPEVVSLNPITDACILAPNGGLVFRFNGHQCCGLQLELDYLQRGWNDKENGVTRRLHYIELPFLAHINFGTPAFRAFFNLGPQIGYCILDEGSASSADDATHPHLEAITHPFDWGATAGLGFYVRTHNAGAYQMEARFAYSLGGVYATGTKDYFSMANPMTLSLNLAWFWEFRRRTVAEALSH